MQAPRTHSGRNSGAEFRIAVRVYYEDTDAGGVVYYANYLRFCERARTEWLRDKGFSQRSLMADVGVAFVVRRLTAEFNGSAQLDDELEVLTSIERLGGASIVFSQRILRADECLFEARVTVACIDLGRHAATAIPAAIRSRLLPSN